MPRKKIVSKSCDILEVKRHIRNKSPIEFKNSEQSSAWDIIEKHDVVFLLGPAGTGKSHIATSFAINQLLKEKCERIILSRPIVACEDLGYLPGDISKKTLPFMLPLFDIISKLVGFDGLERKKVNSRIEVAPIAYLRGRTFSDSICILDEAQNATWSQLLLFLTRMGENSKMIITGDSTQSDLRGQIALTEMVKKLRVEPKIGIVEFSSAGIVRHPLLSKIIGLLDKN